MTRRRSADIRHQESLAQIGKSAGYLLREVRSALGTIGTLTLSLQKKARTKLSKGEQKALDRIVEEQAALEDMLQNCLDYMGPLRSDGERIRARPWRCRKLGQPHERRSLMCGKKPDHRQQERLARLGKRTAYLLHQVRSPVVTIGLLGRSLQKNSKLTKKEQDKVDQIVGQAAALEAMLRDCLDYLGPSRAGRERISAVRLVEWLSAATLPQASNAKVTLIVDIRKNLPTFLGHRRLLRQALFNIVENAIEASRPRRGTVSVGVRHTTKNVVLEVIDTGSGMTPEATKEAFEPFYSRKERGIGLGLPFTKKVVQDHGGSVSIKSAPGEGTQVTIRLPVAVPEEASSAHES